MTSNQTPTMPTSFQYSAWRHGGWYVDNVRYPSGAIGCVSRNYADGKWRIACDPRPFDQQPTFKSRDDAARAEWLLANAPEPVAGGESTDALADDLATLAKGVCEATAARLRGIAETGTTLLTLELASAIRSHARAERDIELGKLPSTADWLTVQRFAEGGVGVQSGGVGVQSDCEVQMRFYPSGVKADGNPLGYKPQVRKRDREQWSDVFIAAFPSIATGKQWADREYGVGNVDFRA